MRMSEDNRSLLEKLKAEDSFVFQDPFAIDTPGTIYRNRVIKDIILEALYNNREKSLGVTLKHIIGEAMPLPVIALAATVKIENTIDEYEQGIHQNMDFTEAAYHRPFSHHLKQLHTWGETDTLNGTSTFIEYQKQLVTLGRRPVTDLTVTMASMLYMLAIVR
ncbi:hypothetical protein PM082_015603 [Marasmius tenuissimus]|nr:hypothetical protein PM082_015603 [Marasmius tenuissimus]